MGSEQTGAVFGRNTIEVGNAPKFVALEIDPEHFGDISRAVLMGGGQTPQKLDGAKSGASEAPTAVRVKCVVINVRQRPAIVVEHAAIEDAAQKATIVGQNETSIEGAVFVDATASSSCVAVEGAVGKVTGTDCVALGERLSVDSQHRSTLRKLPRESILHRLCPRWFLSLRADWFNAVNNGG